ncbi:MAG TPA: hypothetical protein VNP96_00605 [Solirubrobacterales bacterium]|nr:hypothetical protein [Solirubrobacterales bacterium]
MRKRLGAAIAAISTALLLLAPGAQASTEAGWNCTANGSKAGWTLLATPQEPLPVSPLVKESPGVIVGWVVRVGPGLGQFAQQLGVFRESGGGQYTKVAESAVETFPEGFTQYPARIPVQKGDLLGLHGPTETLYCHVGPSALFEGGIAVGETKAFVTEGAFKPPVSAVVEGDLDGDGYGDQSQDGCPTSALFQTECPIVALDIDAVEVRHRAILVEVGVNSETSVEALGEVRWTVRPKARGGAKPSSKGRRVRVGLSAPARTVLPGTTAVLRVPLPRSVRQRLDRLAPQRALRARIDVKGTNLVPYVGTQELKVELPGRAQPQPPR